MNNNPNSKNKGKRKNCAPKPALFLAPSVVVHYTHSAENSDQTILIQKNNITLYPSRYNIYVLYRKNN